MLDRAQQARWGRIGGLRSNALHDSRELTSAARAGFLRRFENEVDPNAELEPAERARRAERAMRAHMLELAERSARVRRRRAPEAA